MADVQPLYGLRYSTEHRDAMADVITPPFDVINASAQLRYYDRHPHNIIRLELAQARANDNSLNNAYTRASATFAQWRLQGVLQQDQQPCYYLYQQRFTHEGQSYTRTSLLARVRLEDWDKRVVLPHEHTRKKDKEDRLQLLRACSANFSPIMCMYDDPQGRIRGLLKSYAQQPETHITDEIGEEHILHPVQDPQQVALIQDFFAQRQLYIADGHHRYTTALQYRDEIRALRSDISPDDGVNFMLMALIDIDDPGMLVLPTHRLLSGLSAQQLDQLSTSTLAPYFTVQTLLPSTPVETLFSQLAQAGQQNPSFIVKTANQTLLLSVNDAGQAYMQTSSHSPAWNTLDVAIVQKMLFEHILGITEEDVASGRYLRYAHDNQTTFEALNNQEAQAIILLNGIPFSQVRDVALADDRMPQKSTYLYPKLTTGLLINPLW